MPTNIFRNKAKGAPVTVAGQDSTAARERARAAGTVRVVTFTIGRATLEARLSDTPTADRFWAALPIFSVAETWGDTIHFETPMPSGRDRSARINARSGDICFWTSDNRVIIAFGPSPISRPGEIRLPQLCNVFGEVMGDPGVLKIVTPGEKVSVTALR